MSKCKICRKESESMRNGFCSKECVWEFLSMEKPKPNKDEDEIDDAMFVRPVHGIERFASDLRREIPASEKWFWEKYKQSGLSNKDDLANFPLRNVFIPDVHNEKYKYVIEVDGKYHETEKQKKKDARKDRLYKKWGYKVFRIKAFSTVSFVKFCLDMKEYHKERLGLKELTPEMILNPKSLLKKGRKKPPLPRA